MTEKLNKIAKYLGGRASDMLGEVPFKSWSVEKSYEKDLEPNLIDYIFSEQGMELQCDNNNMVKTIFLYSKDYKGFDENLIGIPFSTSRKKVLELFGCPSQSGERLKDSILGDYGPWDRFSTDNYVAHFEYEVDNDHIERITLMGYGVVPKG